jgi:NTP pyrophosphatase (non-canonical NTP hydrolase)
MSGLDLGVLRAINAARCARWHGPDTEPWSLADWSNAMCGEAGEAANVVKKIRRIDTGTDQDLIDFPRDPTERRRIFVDLLAAELADVVIYADLVAAAEGIDLAAAVVEKFNAVSEREGFPERLVSA